MTSERERANLKTFSVDSWDSLRQAVDEVRSLLEATEDEELWFRGVRDREYPLLPSLFRVFGQHNPKREAVRKLEVDLFFEFLSKARAGGGTGLDHWDVLFLMQHYGVPTRLLDWTEVLNVALYFAVSQVTTNPDRTPRIFAINPYLWNQEHVGERDLFWPKYFGYDADEDWFYEYGEILVDGGADWEFPVSLYPPQRESRLAAQRGFFTIHGYDHRPLERISPEMIVAIDLEQKAIHEIAKILEYGGVNEYSLFPDLEGLARTLRKKYKL